MMTVNNIKIGNDWDHLLKEVLDQPYFKTLIKNVMMEYEHQKVYPKIEDIFNSFKYTPFQEVKVVIIGQDPYHNPNQAHGLSFSVPYNERIPKSLNNIFIELSQDLKIDYPLHGNLTKWAQQGVLLLNTILTVVENKPGSHKSLGWEHFTDEVISLINKKQSPVVFMLWGNEAKSKESLITNRNHLVLKSTHPSPLSAHRGFFGCRHFSKTNEFLKLNHIEPIDWNLK